MAEKHNMSFFGKNQALIVNTYSLIDKIHLIFIQKIDEKWQKINEGVQVALNLNEVCEIADLLETKKSNVNIIHSSPTTEDVKNFILEFNNSKDILFIKAKLDNKPGHRKFSKPIKKGDLRLFTKLWIHMENEKVANYSALNNGR